MCIFNGPTPDVLPSGDHRPKLLHPQCHDIAAWHLLQDGQLLSFGRPTYGGLGRAAVDTQSDNAEPQPQRVDGMDGVSVAAAAAGGFCLAKSLTAAEVLLACTQREAG